jgi:hypothetical protein
MIGEVMVGDKQVFEADGWCSALRLDELHGFVMC